MYKLGSIYEISDHDYILAQVSYKQVCLVGLENGNRWREPIQVKIDHNYSITDEDFNLCCNKNVKLISINYKTYKKIKEQSDEELLILKKKKKIYKNINLRKD